MNIDILRTRLLSDRYASLTDRHEAVEMIISQLALQPDNIVLDTCAGRGALLNDITAPLTASGWVDAYNPTPDLLGEAARAYTGDKVRFILGDIEHAPIFGAYDALLLYCVMPLLDHPEETVARLYADNLMPGGRLVIAYPCSKEEVNSMYSDTPACFLDSADELAARLRARGLNVTYTLDTDSAYILTLTK